MTEHDKKYRKIVKELRLKIKMPYMGKDLTQWKTLFKEDRHLNNVPLILWDKEAERLKFSFFARKMNWSLCLGVCALKYAVKREVKGLSS